MEQQNIIYSKSVGQKFQKNGSLKNFPGNTIICPLSTKQPFYQTMIELQNIYKNSSIGYKYSFLPPSSFHMTVMSMICKKTLKQWNDRCKLCFSIQQTDEHFAKIIKENQIIQNIKNLRMKAVKIIGNLLVQVVFEDPDQQKLVNFMHKRVYQKSGVQIAQNYEFHLTLAYKIIELTEKQQEQKKKIDAQIEKKINGAIINLLPAQYTIFQDMGQFIEYKDKTTRQKLHQKLYGKQK